jgi:hypothetical protein
MRMGIKAKGALLKDDPKERTTAIIFEVMTWMHVIEAPHDVCSTATRLATLLS